MQKLVKKYGCKTLSVILCALIMCTAFPLNAFALDEEPATVARIEEAVTEPKAESEPAAEAVSEAITNTSQITKPSEQPQDTVTEPSSLPVNTEPEIVETKVNGLKTEFNAKNTKKLKMKLTVSPSNGGRTVILQRYISKQKKYVKVKAYKTADKDSAKITVALPAKYRKKTRSVWRVVIEENDKATKYVSPKNTVYTINPASLSLNADCACIYDIDTGKILYSKNIHKAHKQASTTKIMTSVLLIESGKLSSNTKITKLVANTPYANMGMKAGDIYRNRDLLYSLMLPSSNDSASAIAVGVSSSQKKFVKEMNKKAEALGLENTVFSNPHGLDSKKNHTTAFDLVRMTAYASQYKNFMKVIGTSKYSFKTVKYKKRKTVRTTDKLKSYSSRHLGGKTGFTSGAGYCFSSVYKYKGHRYAVCVLGSRTIARRWTDMKKLYKYVNKYANQKH